MSRQEATQVSEVRNVSMASAALAHLPCLAAFAVVVLAAFMGSAAADYIPYTPTPQAMVERMIERAQVKADDFLIDLGCGDGRILVAAAQRTGARGLGVDIDAQRLVEANALARKAGVADKVTFRKEDLFKTDISKASVLALYLGLAINIELRPRILATMKPGSRVLSHHFNMGDWLPDQREMVEGRMLYFWIVPAKVDGSWKIAPVGSGGFTLQLEQVFQMLKGTATIEGEEFPIRDGRVTGERVRFVIDKGESGRTAFEGRLIDGHLEGDGWTATRH